MSELQDPHNYEDWLIFDELPLWPPSLPRSSCLIGAAVHGSIETLKVLLDSPEWYKVTDKSGRSLLHIAVELQRDAVFHYLLSLEGYPLDEVNNKKETALMTCLKLDMRGLFAQALIAHGAELNLQNHEGHTVLHLCCKKSEIPVETMCMLLYYGADPSICEYSHGYNVFEASVIWSLDDQWNDEILSIQENLFYLTFDEHAYYPIDLKILVALAGRSSPLFHAVYNYINETHFTEDPDFATDPAYGMLLQMDLEYLKLLNEKFEDGIGEVLSTSDCFSDAEEIKLENAQFLVEGNLKPVVIEAISYTLGALFKGDLRRAGVETATEKLCFMLSYGMKIRMWELEAVHIHFRHCDLFRMLLHMDIEDMEDWHNSEFARLYYDVRTDIEKICHPSSLTSYEMEQLLGLCAHQKMKDDCCTHGGEEIARKVGNLPQLPLLVELARNVFRKYFIRRMNITCAKDFYTKVKLLPIGAACRDIITYERKIYQW